MDRFLHLRLSDLCCRRYRCTLALLWVFGVLFGLLHSYIGGFRLRALIHVVLFSDTNFLSLLSAAFLPLFISYLIVWLSRPIYLLPLVFLKGFLFAFISFTFYCAFRSSAALLLGFFLFGDLLTMPVLWWIWVSSFSDNKLSLLLKLCCAFAFAAFICLFNSFVLVPFLSCVM